MNYEQIYKNFIDKYKDQEILLDTYYEKHHIIPKHMGGGNEESNLIKLTLRQHTFAHLVLWKAYQQPSDLKAYLLMSGTEEDERKANQVAGGRANAVSGHLDKIRHLANTPERQAKLIEMNKAKWESGEGLKAVRAANKAWKGQHHTEEFKEGRSKDYKKRFKEPKWKDYGESLAKLGRKVRSDLSKESSETLINCLDVDTVWLEKESSRSKYLFVTPTGLTFSSVRNMYNYFKHKVPLHTLENWCKREQHGWSRIIKPK